MSCDASLCSTLDCVLLPCLLACSLSFLFLLRFFPFPSLFFSFRFFSFRFSWQAGKHYPIALWGPILLGTIAGCGGLFLPLDKGLKASEL